MIYDFVTVQTLNTVYTSAFSLFVPWGCLDGLRFIYTMVVPNGGWMVGDILKG